MKLGSRFRLHVSGKEEGKEKRSEVRKPRAVRFKSNSPFS
jgi:hypothetical protein